MTAFIGEGRGRIVGWTLGTALGAQVAVSMLQQGLPSIGLALHTALDLSLPQLGLLLGTANVATAVTVLAWGIWSDRVGDRKVLLIGLPLAAVGTAIAAAAGAAAGGLPMVFIGLAVAGVGTSAGTAALARSLAERMPAARLGLALGLRQAAVPVGGLLAAVALPLVAALAGPAGALGLLAVLLSAAALTIAVKLPAQPLHPASVRSTQPERSARASSWLGTPGLGRLLASNAGLCVAQTGTVTLSVIAWQQHLHLSAAFAGLLFAAAQAATGVVRVVVGRAADVRPGREPVLLRWLGASTVAGLALLASADGLGAPPWVRASLLFLVCVPAGGWNGLAFSQSTRMTLEAGHRARLGRVHGAQNTVLFAAVGLTPPVATILIHWAGWPFLWVAMALAGATGVVLQPLRQAEVTEYNTHQPGRGRHAHRPSRSSCPDLRGRGSHHGLVLACAGHATAYVR